MLQRPAAVRRDERGRDVRARPLPLPPGAHGQGVPTLPAGAAAGSRPQEGSRRLQGVCARPRRTTRVDGGGGVGERDRTEGFVIGHRGP